MAYIILEQVEQDSVGEESDLPPPTISIAELSDKEAIAESKHPGQTVAEAMPARLIRPFALDESVDDRVESSWGIVAVQATTSTVVACDITVAVIDTGVMPEHPAFSGIEVESKNYTDDGDDKDSDGHGTHCAGVLIGQPVGGIPIGVAKGVKRLLVGKVFTKGGGGGNSAKIGEAILWAIQEGAQVVAMSLGIDFTSFVAELQERGLPESAAISRALTAYRDNVALFETIAKMASNPAFKQPALLIAASGNESKRNMRPPYTVHSEPPAVSPGFLSVGP